MFNDLKYMNPGQNLIIKIPIDRFDEFNEAIDKNHIIVKQIMPGVVISNDEIYAIIEKSI